MENYKKNVKKAKDDAESALSTFECSNNNRKSSSSGVRLDPKARAKRREELKKQAEENLHKIKQTTQMKAKATGESSTQSSKDKVFKQVQMYIQTEGSSSSCVTSVSLQSKNNRQLSLNERLNTDNKKASSDTVKKQEIASKNNNRQLYDEDVEMEAMDWEELPEAYVLNQIQSLRQDKSDYYSMNQEDEEMTAVVEKNNSNSLIDLSKFETMEQYLNYKNLLNADEFDAKHFYIVVDTNIFISNLSLVENLPKTLFKSKLLIHFHFFKPRLNGHYPFIALRVTALLFSLSQKG